MKQEFILQYILLIIIFIIIWYNFYLQKSINNLEKSIETNYSFFKENDFDMLDDIDSLRNEINKIKSILKIY
jgi:peptidoglycan hydrolase CwlO-like protein